MNFSGPYFSTFALNTVQCKFHLFTLSMFGIQIYYHYSETDRLLMTFFFLFLCRFRSSSLRFNCFPAGIYLLRVDNRNNRIRCEICSKLTIKTSERRQWRRSGTYFFFLCGFSFTTIHESQDCRGRRRAFL